MAEAPPAGVQELFGALRKAVLGGKHDKVVSTANEILAVDPTDGEALQVKVVSLAKKGKFQEALDAAGAGADLAAERAYCAYRLGRLDEALAECGGSEAGLAAHVRAQVHYKRGEYGEAARTYDALCCGNPDEGNPSAPDDDEAELLANRFASYARAGDGGRVVEAADACVAGLVAAPRRARHQYELAHNAACAELDAGRPRLALAALDAALSWEKKGDEDEDDEEDDFYHLRSQRAACAAALGRSAEAVDECKRLLKEKPSEAAVVLATNNLFAARGTGATAAAGPLPDLFDSQKRFKPLVALVDDEAKATDLGLTRAQRAAIRLNWAILLLHLGRLGECRDAADRVDDLFPGACAAETATLRAYVKVRQQPKKQQSSSSLFAEELDLVERELSALSAAASSTSSGGAQQQETALLFAVAQCRASAGRYTEAAAVLAGTKAAPERGVASTVAELLEAAGDVEGAKRTLSAAASSETASATETRALAVHQLRLGDAERATAALRRLPPAASGDDATAHAATIALATSFFDPDNAEMALLGDVADEEDDLDGEDAEALFDAPPPRSTRKAALLTGAAAASTKGGDHHLARTTKKSHGAILRRRATKRAAYVAKLEAAGTVAPPDPERWIAKKQRSYNKRGRKNRGKFVGAQGGDANVKDVAKLDAFARAQAKKAAETIAADEATAAGPRGKKGRQPRKRK